MTKNYTVPIIDTSVFNNKDIETMIYGLPIKLIGVNITNNSGSTGLVTDDVNAGVYSKNYSLPTLGLVRELLITPQTSAIKKAVFYKIK
jgi:hypothetical protein